MILSIEQIIRYLHHYGIYLIRESMTLYEESILFGLGNLVWFMFLFLMFYVLYKIFGRVVNSLF